MSLDPIPPKDPSILSENLDVCDLYLNSLISKLFNFQHLNDQERRCLELLSERRLGVVEKISSLVGEVKKLKGLASDILCQKRKIRDVQLEIKLKKERTLSEQNALASLLLAYDQGLTNSDYQRRLAEIFRSKGEITDQELEEVLQEYNQISLPTPSKAGTLAFQIGNRKIFYDEQGRLKAGVLDVKKTKPFEATECLSASEQASLKAFHRELTSSKSYNNLGPLLELMRFYRACRQNNPSLTLREAFEAFTPNLEEIFDKYQSGDCVILSGKFKCAVKRKFNVDLSILGQYTGPIWSRPPIPLPQMEWDAYDQLTENVHHTGAAVLFKDFRGVIFKFFGATFDDPIQEGTWREINPDLYGNQKDTKGSITNIENTLKMQMRGKYKVVVTGENENQIFGLDFIQGNIYLNSDGVKGLEGLPLNATGKFSIPLDLTLRNTYYIHGEPIEMSGGEALHLFANIASSRFRLPLDFEENLQTLANLRDEFIDSLLLQPVNTAKKVNSITSKAFKMFSETSQRKDFLTKRLRSKTLPQATEKLVNTYLLLRKELGQAFQNMQLAIMRENSDEVVTQAEIVSTLYAKLSDVDRTITGDF